MSSDEQKQILKMVEAGKISADEAMKLIKALEEAPVGDELEVIAPEATSGRSPEPVEGHGPIEDPEFLQGRRPSSGSGREGASDVEFEEVKARARRFAAIPLGIGVLITVLASYWLFALVQNANYGFWFACAWFPLLLGVLLVALSAGGMNARWLYVNVDQRPGEWPQHITLGIPIPLGLLGWLLQTFGNFIPRMDRQRADEIMTLLATIDAHGPLIVNANEDEGGERVQVYIG
jgi:hypothetical protein